MSKGPCSRVDWVRLMVVMLPPLMFTVWFPAQTSNFDITGPETPTPIICSVEEEIRMHAISKASSVTNSIVLSIPGLFLADVKLLKLVVPILVLAAPAEATRDRFAGCISSCADCMPGAPTAEAAIRESNVALMRGVRFQDALTAFTGLTIVSVAGFLELLPFALEAYTYASLDGFMMPKTPPGKRTPAVEELQELQNNVNSPTRLSEYDRCIKERVSEITTVGSSVRDEAIPDKAVGKMLHSIWNPQTWVEQWDHYAAVARNFEGYFCHQPTLEFAKIPNEEHAQNLRTCQFNAQGPIGIVVGTSGAVVAPLFTIFEYIYAVKWGWKQGKKLAQNKLGLLAVGEWYNGTRAITHHVVAALWEHRFNPCTTMLHPLERPPVQVPVAPAAKLWVDRGHNWAALPLKYHELGDPYDFPMLIYESGYKFSVDCFGYIPLLFDAEVVQLEQDNSFTTDTEQLFNFVVKGATGTILLAGAFYSEQVIMDIDLSRTMRASISAPMGNVTDPFSGRNFGPASYVLFPEDTFVDWDGRYWAAPPVQVIQSSLHPNHLLSYNDKIILDITVGMDIDVYRGALLPAISFADDMNVLTGLVQDFAASSYVVDRIAEFDNYGLRMANCQHTDTALDADCITSSLVQCATLLSGDGTKDRIPPPTSELESRCFDNSAKALEMSEPVRKELSQHLVSEGLDLEYPAMDCYAAMFQGRCFQDKQKFARFSSPDATKLAKIELQFGPILAEHCPLACHNSPFKTDCPVHPRRQVCFDLVTRMVPAFTGTAGFESRYRETFAKIIAKAAWNNQQSSSNNEASKGYLKTNSEIVGSVGKKAGLAIKYEPLMGLSVIWLCLSGGLTIVLGLQLALAFYDKGLLGILHHINAGSDFTLSPDNLHQAPPTWCSNIGIRVMSAGIMLGVLLGEGTLPTTQYCPPWFYIDMFCIGGAERISEVLLPRFSILGVPGAFSHITGFMVRARSTLMLLVVSVGVCISSLVLVIDKSLNGGNDDVVDTMYWLVPLLSQLFAIVGTLVYMLREESTIYGKPISWAQDLHVPVKTASRASNFTLAKEPIHWVHFMLSVDHQLPFAQVYKTLVALDTAADSTQDVSVFILDDPPPFEAHVIEDSFPPPCLVARVPAQDARTRVETAPLALHQVVSLVTCRLPTRASKSGNDGIDGLAQFLALSA